MANDKITKELKRIFSFLEKEDVLGVLAYGSFATDEGCIGDIDICIVAPKMKSRDVLKKVFSKVDVRGKNLDVYCFEEMPLYIKWEVINNNKIIWVKDEGELGEYFHLFRKLYDDQKHRMKLSREEISDILKKSKTKD